MADLAGKVILVTGAGAGIGRGIAARAAEVGGRIVVGDVDLESAEETVGMLRDGGAEALAIEVDIARDDQVEAMVSLAVEKFGRLDAAVNNAGVWPPPKPTIEHTPADFDRILSVNVKGTWSCLAHEARRMRSTGGGSIVNIGSAVGFRARRDSAAYGASKAAIMQLSRIAALELADDGVRVNVVSPGPVDGPNFGGGRGDPDIVRRLVAEAVPLGRLGRPVDIADAVLWLCSADASFVTGAVFPVDGGESL